MPTAGRAALLGLSLSLVLSSGCAARPATWEYPIRLGDSRERVYDFVGLPTERIEEAATTSVIEWFPNSGLSVEFDQFGKARVLHFPGEYHLEGWITSDRRVVFGLHARATRTDFERELGGPALRVSEGDSETLTWRRDQFAILAEFWSRDLTQSGRTFRAGSLRRMEVSPAQ